MLECMKELDPSLGVWQPHLTAACRLFSQKSLFSVLLLTQICMSVSQRVALSPSSPALGWIITVQALSVVVALIWCFGDHRMIMDLAEQPES